MKTGNNPNEFNISLIQQRDQRQVMVEKMRGKLAGHSQSFIQAKERQAYATRKRAFVLGWRVALVGVFLLGNIYYIASRPEAPAKAAAKKAPRLPAPGGHHERKRSGHVLDLGAVRFRSVEIAFRRGTHDHRRCQRRPEEITGAPAQGRCPDPVPDRQVGPGGKDPHMNLPIQSRQAGFSLIEILVSAVVIGILATAAFYFLSAQNGMGAAGNDSIKGLNLGKLKLDSLKVTAYDELVSGSDTVNERYIRAWHVTIQRDGLGVPDGRKKIDIDVLWPLTGLHTVSLVTLKSDDRYKEETP